MSQLNVLLLSHVKPGFANTCFDHQDALSVLSRNRVVVVSPVDHPGRVPDLSVFDVVIVHYSIICFSRDYVSPAWRQALGDFRGLKVVFIQDEYRSIWAANDAMLALGVDVLFTCVPAAAVEPVYGQLRQRGVRIEPTLTGYVPDSLLGQAFRPLAERPLDAVYRGRPLPYSLGRLATEKVEIARKFRELAPRHGLRHDVDWREESRIYGQNWNEFLASGRCALGTESGASICDFTDDVDRAVRLYMLEHPHASYEDILEDLLAPVEGNVVINAISPRAFEAIGLGTALVQFPGEYSGLLERGRHYIELDKDFANFAEVADAMRDIPRLERMVRTTYDDVIASGRWSYRTFAAHVDALLEEEWLRRVHREPVVLPAGIAAHAPPALPAGAEALQQWIEASLAPLPDDYAQAEAGARVVGDSGFFERPHDADYLLRPVVKDGYAAALTEGGSPQWLEIDLGRIREAWLLRLEWYRSDNFAQAFMIEGRSSPSAPWELLGHELDNRSEHWTCGLAGRPVRWVRLSAWKFMGQRRILLRRFQVQGRDRTRITPPPPAPRGPVAYDVLQSGLGTRIIGSSAFFDKPHDPDCLLSDILSPDVYAAAMERAGPHWIEFDLGRDCLLNAAFLAWFSEEHRCTGFALLGRTDAQQAWRTLATRSGESAAATVMSLEASPVRQLRLEASDFTGQQRLLLRAFSVIGSPVGGLD